VYEQGGQAKMDTFICLASIESQRGNGNARRESVRKSGGSGRDRQATQLRHSRVDQRHHLAHRTMLTAGQTGRNA